MQKRRRFKQSNSLNDRLGAFAQKLREQAGETASPVEKQQLNGLAKNADEAILMYDWLTKGQASK